MKSDHRRFAQLVRKLVRDHVRETGDAPALTLWVSPGGDPRAAAAIPVGAALDPADVRFRAVSAVEDAGAHFAAVGRRLSTPVDGKLEQTGNFGLIVFGRGEPVPIAWKVPVVNGRLGGWFEWVMSPASVYEAFRFVPAALERVAKSEEEG